MMYLKTLLFTAVLICCGHRNTPANAQCKLTESDFNVSNLSPNPNDLSNTELKLFNESDFKYDILYYSSVEGSNKFSLERWYISDNDKWMHVKIIDNKKNSEELIYNQDETNDIFKVVSGNSYIQTCGSCFDCNNYTLLIKNEKNLFKYISNAYFLTNLDEEGMKSIMPYAKAFNYLKNK